MKIEVKEAFPWLFLDAISHNSFHFENKRGDPSGTVGDADWSVDMGGEIINKKIKTFADVQIGKRKL